ncbi:MAG: hypothetical protein LUH82_07845 [Clostridiales bacterium]|nr:hypothetical protein [Clostridiales bacterium]
MEKENKGKSRICISLEPKLLDLCDANIARFNVKSRSDLISLALECLFATKDSEMTANIISPALQSVIQASVRNTENHISRYLYKQAVEIAMLYNIVAYANNITEAQLNNVRSMCEKEVKNLSGKYSLEEAVRFQNGGE